MKNTLLVALILLASATKAQSWVQLNSGTTTHLRDVFFLNADSGYVVGEDSTLLLTVDGGNSWHTLPSVNASNPGNLNAIWMTDMENGFIAPEFLADIPRTSNGGTSWIATGAGIGNPCYPDGLLFDGPNEGFMYGHGCFGGAYIAHWNGSTWDYSHMLDYSTSPFNAYIGIRGMAKDPVSGAHVAVGDRGKIFRSTDAFQTWDTIVYPDTTDFTAIDYAGNNTFYASGKGIINSMFVSTDGGNSFQYDAAFMPTFFYSGFYDVDMLDNGFGVTVGYSQTTGGGFIQWRNQGQGWANYEAVDHILKAVYVVDSTVAFAVGDSGAIYRYSPFSVGMQHTATPKPALRPFPSPLISGEPFALEFPAGAVWNLEIIDMQGRTLSVSRELAGKQELRISTAPGLYLLRATSTDNRTITTKVMVQ